MKRSQHKVLLILSLLMLAAGVTSCRDASHKREIRDALQLAETLMETDPHAARAVLDSLMPNVDCQTSDSQTADECLGKGSRAKVLSDSLNGQSSESRESALSLPSREARRTKFKSVSLKSFSRKDAALYALLRTQADYKCDIPIRSDSLARIATDYYGTPRRPDNHAAMAWYTLGCAYKEMNDDVNGTDAFLKAKSLFPDTLVRYYALTEQNLGLHYMNRVMKNEAIHEFQCAKRNFSSLSDSAAVAFQDLKIAQCLLYKEEYITAREYLVRVFNNPFARDIILNNAHFEMAKIEAYDSHDFQKAQEHLDNNIRHTTDKKKLAGSYSLKADIFQSLGKLDSAWYFTNKSLSCYPSLTTFAYVYLHKAYLAPQLGKTDSIQYYIKQHDHYVDTLYAISNQQAIRQVMNDHRVEMEQQRLEYVHHRLVLTLSLAALALVILVLAVLAWSLNTANQKKRQYIQISDRLKQTQMEEERRKTELVAAKEEAERLKAAYQEARQRVEELECRQEDTTLGSKVSFTPQKERMLVLSDYENRIRICANQFRKDLSWELVQKYLHGSEHFLTKQERSAVRYDLNVCFADYYEILLTEGKKVNRTEKMVSACYILGLKSEETGEVLGFSDDTVRVQKHRLKGKLPADFFEIVFSFRL